MATIIFSVDGAPFAAKLVRTPPIRVYSCPFVVFCGTFVDKCCPYFPSCCMRNCSEIMKLNRSKQRKQRHKQKPGESFRMRDCSLNSDAGVRFPISTGTLETLCFLCSLLVPFLKSKIKNQKSKIL